MLRRPKALNSPTPFVVGMGDNGYFGRIGYGAKDVVKGSLGALAGLAGIVATALPADAQDVSNVAYRDTNLAAYGVPNFEGMTPFNTKYLDQTDLIPGKETRRDAYRIGPGFISTYSIDEKMYAVSLDLDGKRPLDYAFTDKNGNGDFSRVPINSKFYVPSWAVGR